MAGRGQGQGFKGKKVLPGNNNTGCEICGFKNHVTEKYPSDFKTKRKQSDSCGSYQNNTEGFRSHGTYNSNVYNNTGNFKPYVNYASVDKQKEESEFTKKEYNQMKNLLHNKEQSDCKANLKGNTSLQTKSSAYDWIIDSRATHHVASYEELMYELKNTRNEHPSTIQLPTGSKAQDANLTDLWHFRLGHPPIEVMKQIPSLKKYFNITTYSCCHICPVAKQSRLSFPTNSVEEHVEETLINPIQSKLHIMLLLLRIICWSHNIMISQVMVILHQLEGLPDLLSLLFGIRTT
uniref:GAG-pre-integrase domain-containing protein n=1 Tax=Solanum lycopersicum TaxID=4081 RepID=A0A3Q7E9Y0_SOLLC